MLVSKSTDHEYIESVVARIAPNLITNTHA